MPFINKLNKKKEINFKILNKIFPYLKKNVLGNGFLLYFSLPFFLVYK